MTSFPVRKVVSIVGSSMTLKGCTSGCYGDRDTIWCSQSVTPETAPLRKAGRSAPLSAQVCVSPRSLDRTIASQWRSSALL